MGYRFCTDLTHFGKILEAKSCIYLITHNPKKAMRYEKVYCSFKDTGTTATHAPKEVINSMVGYTELLHEFMKRDYAS